MKREVIKKLEEKGINVLKVETELLEMLRAGASSLEIESYLRKIVEGDEDER